MTTKEYLQVALYKVQNRKQEAKNNELHTVVNELECIEKDIQDLIIQDISYPEEYHNETKVVITFTDMLYKFTVRQEDKLEQLTKVQTKFNTHVTILSIFVVVTAFTVLYLFLK